MSRFFHGGSESESESEASEAELPPRPTVGTRNLRYSDDDEDTKRTVRSEKDKRYEELHNIIKQLKNHKKIRDMSSVLTDFEQLGKAYDKAKNVVDREGIPRFYIKCLADLEDFVNTCWEDRDWRKTINKNNAKGLSTLRQKLRKYNRDFETPISNYRESPDDGDDDRDYDEDGEEKDEDSETETAATATSFLKKPAAEVKGSDDEVDDDEDDDSDWPSESSESSESDIDRGESGYPTAEYFLKKTTEAESSKKEDRKKLKRDKKDKRVQEDEGEWEEVRGGAPMAMEKPKMFAKDQEITHEAVYKKLFEIVSARGKKATDRSEQLELLHELKTVSEAHNLGPAMSSKIHFNIIAAIFDYNPNIATCMKSDMWDSTLETIGQILELLNANRDIHIGENILEESEVLDASPYRVRGSLLAVVERMDEEYIKMLQACDAHSTEYVERLKDEQKVCDLVERVQVYYEERGSTSDELCRIYLRRIEHLYYKFDETRFSVKGKTASEQLMDKLCKYLYSKDNTDRLRTRAMLCNIFHLAVHDRWYEARDLMLMSHLQDIIQHSDVPTQLLYNRTLVQLGLCAFRQGMTKDAHNALVDIQSSNRSKELLAQGLLPQRQHERTPEQEKIDKRRLLPYHMHINLELLECVYLVSAMLMEIPYMAAHELDVRRRMISKNFHHVMKMSERQTLTGPPESMREHVVAASKAMKIGDWKACKNFIINEKMNTKVWDLFQRADVVREMITSKIQEESLRTYLFTYSSIYDSFCLDNLAEMFQLEKPVAHSIISKMILNEELMASLDEPTQSVIMHQTEPSRLQSLALQLSEKVSTLVENNERVMEIKQGNFFFSKSNTQNYQNQQQGWGQGRWGDGGRRGQQNKDRRQNRRGYDRGGYDRGGYDRGDRGDRDRGQHRRNYDD